MDTTLKLSKWGQSIGLRIPKKMVKKLDLTSNSHISIKLVNEQIIISKAELEPQNIKELFESKGYVNTPENQALIFPEGNIRGREMI